MTEENKEFNYHQLVLESAMSAFRDYINNCKVKDLPNNEKTFIKKLILLWNDYKDNPQRLYAFQQEYAELASEIKDDRFQLYLLTYAILLNVYNRYSSIHSLGKLSKQEAKRYNEATHAFTKGIQTRGCMPTNDITMRAIIIHAKREWFMNHPAS